MLSAVSADTISSYGYGGCVQAVWGLLDNLTPHICFAMCAATPYSNGASPLEKRSCIPARKTEHEVLEPAEFATCLCLMLHHSLLEDWAVAELLWAPGHDKGGTDLGAAESVGRHRQ